MHIYIHKTQIHEYTKQHKWSKSIDTYIHKTKIHAYTKKDKYSTSIDTDTHTLIHTYIHTHNTDSNL